MKIVIAGCGWLGLALGQRLVADGAEVVGVRRSASGAELLDRSGIRPLALDLSDPTSADALPVDADVVVACQSADGGTLADYERAYVTINRQLLAYAARGTVRRLLYTGSTGVFGQRGGEEVDESTPPVAEGDRGELLLRAEREVLAANGTLLETLVLRLSGLYGPGRYGIIERVRQGRLALGAGQERWMNFCHQVDAVELLRLAIRHGRPGAVYHGSDATPARRSEVVRWIAGNLGLEPARSDTPAGPAADANRRVSSLATRRELGLRLAYPSYRAGLAPALGLSVPGGTPPPPSD